MKGEKYRSKDLADRIPEQSVKSTTVTFAGNSIMLHSILIVKG